MEIFIGAHLGLEPQLIFAWNVEYGYGWYLPFGQYGFFYP